MRGLLGPLLAACCAAIFLAPRAAAAGEDLYADAIDAVQVRKHIGMVFQKPNPFPKSIYENVAFGPKVLGMDGDMDGIVETALRRASLWDEVKDRLKTNAFGMSGGQQQRLCIARALATNPDVILMDEPCSALDPISTGKIEDLMLELRENYSIVIVTHNMQQAARVSDMTAYFYLGRLIEFGATAKIEELITELKNDYTVVIVTHNMQQAARVSDYTAYMYLGEMIEFGQTDQLFLKPQKQATEDYITGPFG